MITATVLTRDGLDLVVRLDGDSVDVPARILEGSGVDVSPGQRIRLDLADHTLIVRGGL